MTVIVERVIETSATVSESWKIVSDTDRLNRAAGHGPVSFSPVKGAGAARFVGKTRLGGFDLEYEDMPSEWTLHRSLRLRRKPRSGPVSEMQFDYTFTPVEHGSRLSIRFAFEMRQGLLTPVVKMRAKQSIERFDVEIRKMVAALTAGHALPPLPPSNGVNEQALTRAAAAFRANAKNIPGELIDRLVEFVRHGDDIDLARIRPFELADAWGVDRRVVLDAMLEGVRAGLFELRWEMVCPSCQQAATTVPSLADLSQHGTCQLCDITFGLELDEALEATFTPGWGVRESDRDRPFCIGGPSRVPHVVAQAILPPDGQVSLEAPATRGRFRLFARGGFTAVLDVKEGAPGSVTILAKDKGEGSPLEVSPGGLVHVTNAAHDERHVKLERSGYSGLAATARIVTAMPKFRRDFSSDLLRPGTTLQVSKVTLFFSDLTASTQLYSTVGDAAAFRLVHDHFEVVIRLIEAHNGALVKTIGDAVMAVFARDLDAVAAGMAILEAFESFRREHPHRQMTHIKLGIHGGPCYAVTANSLLDYFGQTVNIAARLQAQAESGELVLDLDLSEHAVREGILPTAWIGERYEARLKGVDDAVPVVRVRLPPA